MKLWQWQEEFVAWYALRRKTGQHSAYLAADVGTGKTIAALAAAKKVRAKDIVVIAPLSAHQSWLTDGKKMGFTMKLNDNLFTYEKFNRLKRLPVGDLLILDEAHRVKNPKAQITKTMLKYYMEHPKILLSGTPQDRLWELYSQYKLVYPDIWNGMSWSAWVRKYFFLDNYFKPKALIDPKYKDEILKQIDRHTFRVKLEDVNEVPDVELRRFELSKSRKIQKAWREFEAEQLNPVTLFVSEYAIGQGIDPESKTMFDMTKIEWVLDYLRDNPQTLVFSYFRTPVVTIRNKYPDLAYFILGDDKKDLQAAIEFGEKPIIATYALKEGANLTKYRNLLYMSLPLSYRDYYQSRGRVRRSGQQAKKIIENRLLMQRIDYEAERIVKQKQELHEYVRDRKFE